MLHGLDFTVDEGEVVVILGANGAGKTTTLRGAVGIDRRARPGHASPARTSWAGDRSAIAAAGIAHVPQGRGTITDLTVDENLRLGAYTRRDRRGRLPTSSAGTTSSRGSAQRREQQAGSMSGGEQQMLAIARALMARPKLVLLDEPSLGLAPIITQELFRTLGELNGEQGISMLVVEQNAGLALGIAQRGYVLETGSIVVSGSAAELAGNDDVRKAYLGI